MRHALFDTAQDCVQPRSRVQAPTSLFPYPTDVCCKTMLLRTKQPNHLTQ